jgi:FKBP-type peptidyl-prolyl cis-trans isomerase
MTSGIEIKEITLGTGAVAERGKIAVVHLRGFLHRGEECYNTYKLGQPEHIDMSQRDCIAGLYQGIKGMRVGGRRELIVGPHLAYGEKGVPGKIPPNALLRFEVDLLEVRDARVVHPDDYPPGKYLQLFHPGEAARNLPRWQFLLREDGSAGGCITYPLPDMTWRHARSKDFHIEFDQSEVADIFQSVYITLAEFQKDCLQHKDQWDEASEKANGITRDHQTNTFCVTIDISERGVQLLYYSLPETSPVLKGSKFYRIISKAMAPYLEETAWRHNNDAYIKQIVQESIRKAAAEAWQQHDYVKARDFYESITDDLTLVEKKKLEYARNHCKSSIRSD